MHQNMTFGLAKFSFQRERLGPNGRDRHDIRVVRTLTVSVTGANVLLAE